VCSGSPEEQQHSRLHQHRGSSRREGTVPMSSAPCKAASVAVTLAARSAGALPPGSKVCHWPTAAQREQSTPGQQMEQRQQPRELHKTRVHPMQAMQRYHSKSVDQPSFRHDAGNGKVISGGAPPQSSCFSPAVDGTNSLVLTCEPYRHSRWWLFTAAAHSVPSYWR